MTEPPKPYTPTAPGPLDGIRVLDLRSEAGRAMLLKLVRHSQVLVENFVPGGLEKPGLGPDVLLAANPALVIAFPAGARPVCTATSRASARWWRRCPASRSAGYFSAKQ